MKCLLVGERPGVVDGGWSNWSPWSRCSRTCGSGVTLSVRRCVNPVPSNGGAFCRGDRKRHKICTTEVSSPPTLCKSCKESCQKLNQPMEVFDISCRAKMRSEDECLVMDGYRASIDFGIVSVGEMKVNNNCVNNCDYDCVTENRQNWWCRVVKWWLKRVANVVILGGRIIYERRFDDNFIRATKFRGE